MIVKDQTSLRPLTTPVPQRSGRVFTLWALLGVYAVARILTLFPGKLPFLLVLTLHILPPGIFALIHGAKQYSIRGIVVFIALCLGIGNLAENLGVRTGFPFGHYYFTGAMGPKLLVVPMLIGPAYVGMGYISWVLARIIAGDVRRPLAGLRLFTVPLLAALVMVAWDFSNDPVWSTIERCWIWKDGGAWFGVPWSNFLGWYLTVFLIYQSFALYLRKRPSNASFLPRSYWRLAIVFYAVCAAGNLLLVIPTWAGAAVVSDGSGATWRLSQIVNGCTLATLFTMGTFIALAWIRLRRLREPLPQDLAIFLLYYRNGMTTEEIATIYPLTVKGIESLLHRLTRIVRPKLGLK